MALVTLGSGYAVAATPIVLPSLSSSEYSARSEEEQLELLLNAVRERIQRFENVSYEQRSSYHNPQQDCREFPNTGQAIPSLNPSAFRSTWQTQRSGKSYRTSFSRDMRFAKGTLTETTITSFDAEANHYRLTGKPYIEPGWFAIVDTGGNRTGELERFAYWGGNAVGVGERGLYFMGDSLAALELLKSGRTEEVKLETDRIGDIETVKLTFASDRMETRYTGKLSVHFDPARQFLPVAYRLVRRDQTAVRWFEGMLVKEAQQVEGLWWPREFQLLECGGQPIVGLNIAVEDVRIDALTFGRVDANGLKVAFPRGSEVKDYVRGVSYVSDGMGGASGKISSLKPRSFLLRHRYTIALVLAVGCVGLYAVRKRAHTAKPTDTSATEFAVPETSLNRRVRFTVRALLLLTLLLACFFAMLSHNRSVDQARRRASYDRSVHVVRMFDELRGTEGRIPFLQIVSSETGAPVEGVLLRMTLIGPDGGDGGASGYVSDRDGYFYRNSIGNAGRHQYELTYVHRGSLKHVPWRIGDGYLTVDANGKCQPDTISIR